VRASLPLALDLGGLYEQLLRRLAPVTARPGEPLHDWVARAEEVTAKEREVAKSEARLAKEKQFNHKVEINSTLRQLKAELESLTAR
jgi:hypothetical protein